MNLNPSEFYFLNSCLPYNCNTISEKLDGTGGNNGNTYIFYCISKLLFGHTIDKCDGIQNLFNINLENIDTDYINSNYKYILINMQDQLRRNISYYPNTDLIFSNICKFLNKLKLPLLCFGLGSNCFNYANFNNIIDELHDSQKEFIKIISNKCKYFSIRGKYTKQIMDNLNIKNYDMVGCPTFYMNDNKQITRKKPLKIVVAGLPQFVYGNVNDRKIFNLSLPINSELFYFCQDYQEISLMDKKEVNNVKIFYSIDLDEINNFFLDKDLTIGNRVHASIISMNNNILAVCGNTDSRASEMCELYKIPHIKNYKNVKNIEDLVENIDLDEINNNYRIFIKKHLNQYNIIAKMYEIEKINKIIYYKHNILFDESEGK